MKKYICMLGMVLCCLMQSGCIGLIALTSITAEEPTETETEYELKQDKAYFLEDGTKISLWRPFYEDSLIYSYRLPDGQQLLDIILSTSVEDTNSHSNGLKGIKTMTPEALETVRAYYKNQGVLLDIPALLENAYADYKECLEKGKYFELRVADQFIEPCVETERFIGFTTSWSIPERGIYDDLSLYRTVLFDQATGQVIPITDLFTVPEEQAWGILTQLCAKKGYLEPDKIKPLMTPERIHWGQNAVVVYFYVDEVSSLKTGVEIPYDELKGYLHDWAIPEPVPEEEYCPDWAF
ncbi:MAG: hypothetical protein HFI06_06910 [Eubacterium sp.]|nr:hypothetical protein [Eubacterium sp.]